MSARIIPLPSTPPVERPMNDDENDGALPPEAEEWRALDVVDVAPYDAAFFESLADDIDAAIDAVTVTPLRRRIGVPVAIAAVAAVALFALRAPTPTPSSDVPAPLAAEEATPSAEELAEVARAIGRAAGAALYDEQVDDGVLYASADWLDVDDDAVPGTYGSLLEQLDALPGDASLFTPL